MACRIIWKTRMPQSDDTNHVGRVPSPGAGDNTAGDAGLGNPAYNAMPDDTPPRRLRRLHRVWPDRDGNISYLLTPCVDGRARVLDNEATFQRQASKFPRRFSHLQRTPEDSTFQP
jgi:hypothetical protein